MITLKKKPCDSKSSENYLVAGTHGITCLSAATLLKPFNKHVSVLAADSQKQLDISLQFLPKEKRKRDPLRFGHPLVQMLSGNLRLTRHYSGTAI